MWGLFSTAVLFPRLATAQIQSTRDLSVPNFATGTTGRAQADEAAQVLTDDPIYDFNLQQGLPYAPPRVAPRSAYNLKLGSARVNFSGFVNTVYTDNALQTPNEAPAGVEREYDVTINPTLAASLSWRPRENQGLRLDFGVGYRYSVQFSELNTLTFSPNSFLDYQLAIGDVTLTLFNATTSGGGIRPEIVGQQNDPGSIDFNRIENNLGLRAAWTPYQDLSVSGGYNFAINRGFNDEFTSQDSDQHGFNVGTFLRAHPQVSVGLSAGYSMIRFLESFQNDLDTWSIGPVVSYSPSENLNISAQVGYTVVDSQNNGAVADTNDFSGWTYGGSVSHRINKYLNHAVSGGFSVQPGVGANFSQGYNLGYTLSAQLIQGLGLNASFFWNNFEQSSNGLAFQAIVVNGVVILVPVQLNVSQKADFFNISLGSSYQLTTKLNASLAYTYTARVSDVVLEEFDAHSVGLNLNYQF